MPSIHYFYKGKKARKQCLYEVTILTELTVAAVSLQHFQHAPGFPLQKTIA